MKQDKILRPDAKGRICLGKIAKGISSFRLNLNQETGEITLIPYAEVELSEKWLYSNKTALKKIRSGLEQSAQNNTTYKGSFSKYIKD